MAKKAAASKPAGNAGNAGKSAFSQGMGKFAKAWTEQRAEKANSFDNAILETGDHITQLTAVRTGATKNQQPYISFNFKVTHGMDAGKNFSIMRTVKEERDLGFIAKDFQRLGYETVEMTISDIEEIAKELSKEKPYVKVQAKEPEEKKNGDGVWQTIYIQKVLPANEVPAPAKPRK